MARGRGMLRVDAAGDSVAGKRVIDHGPVRAGHDAGAVGYSLPISGASCRSRRSCPVAAGAVAASWRRRSARCSFSRRRSPSIATCRRRARPSSSARGRRCAAGRQMTFTFSGLAASAGVAAERGAGAGGARSWPAACGSAARRQADCGERGRRRQRLDAKRDRLFAELVGRGTAPRRVRLATPTAYASQPASELVAALEHVVRRRSTTKLAA